MIIVMPPSVPTRMNALGAKSPEGSSTEALTIGSAPNARPADRKWPAISIQSSNREAHSASKSPFIPNRRFSAW